MFTLEPGILLNLLLISAGVVIGWITTIVGLGGGFIIVPMLLLLFQFSPQNAVGTSLMVILFNSLSAAVAYMKQHRVNYRLGLVFAGFGIPGTVIGAYLSRLFSKETFGIFFGILLLIVSWGLLKNNSKPESKVKGWFEYRMNLKRDAFFGFLMGVVASVAGIGGGALCMPVMIILLLIPVHIATATSMFIITITSLSAFITHLSLSHVDFNYGLPLSIGTVVGAQLGAYTSKKISGKTIQKGVAVLLLLTAIRLLIGSLQTMM